MSRPKILAATGNQFKIELPPGWYMNLSAVSLKTHNQLITVEYVVDGDSKRNYLGNGLGQNNQSMRDIDTAEDVVTIIPQDDQVVVEVNTYFSTAPSIKGETLKEEKYRSSRHNIIESIKPADAPPGFPDYTYLVSIEDSIPATQVQGAPEYNDALLTVNIMQGNVTPPAPDTISRALAAMGKEAVNEYIKRIGPSPYIGPSVLEPVTPYPVSPYPVAILGAGVSGLYIAMMLDSLGIKYEILEGSGRVGGRIYTHHFPENAGQYQYYDVGAMRYPETTFMTRTFELAKCLGIKMLPYIRANENAFLSYNRVTVTKGVHANEGGDPFKVTEENGGTVPLYDFKKGTSHFWDGILGEFRQYFVDESFQKAFERLKQWDDYSVTSYLLLIKKIPYSVVKWYETMEARTGLFDMSLTETVLASLVFNDPNMKGKEVAWRCFDGGSEALPKAMTDHIKTKPQLYMRAIAISESDDGDFITVKFDSGHNPSRSAQGRTEKKYSNVISTMTFGCLRMVDLDDLYLSYAQREAIRQLAYTPSIKIGLQFRTAWWEGLKIVGGQSSTDRPIRDVVYPSYGPDASHPDGERSNCLIAAYNGMQDSQRLGGLMKGRDTPQEKILLDLVMRDLAAVHRVDVKMLWGQYEDYHVWDFYRDEFQLGAFCQFGPGQFKNTYPHVTQPASKQQRVYFAGEGTSTFHGWVAGALNGAWRSVLEMLTAHPELNPDPEEDIIAKFKRIWGDSEEWEDKTLFQLVGLNQELAKDE